MFMRPCAIPSAVHQVLNGPCFIRCDQRLDEGGKGFVEDLPQEQHIPGPTEPFRSRGCRQPSTGSSVEKIGSGLGGKIIALIFVVYLWLKTPNGISSTCLATETAFAWEPLTLFDTDKSSVLRNCFFQSRSSIRAYTDSVFLSAQNTVEE